MSGYMSIGERQPDVEVFFPRATVPTDASYPERIKLMADWLAGRFDEDTDYYPWRVIFAPLPTPRVMGVILV